MFEPRPSNKEQRSETQQHNARIITAAAQELLTQNLQLDQPVQTELKGLRFHQPEMAPTVDEEYLLQLHIYAQTRLSAEKEVVDRSLGFHILKQSRQQPDTQAKIAHELIHFTQNVYPGYVSQRLQPLIGQGEVIMISYSLNIFQADHEGLGFGQAFFRLTDPLIMRGLELLSLQNKSVIFAYVNDRAVSVKGQMAQDTTLSRHRWSTSIATQPEIGYQSALNLDYLGQTLLAENGPHNLSVKVYRDLTLHPPVDRFKLN